MVDIMKHSDVCTHIDNEEDVDILTRQSFNVNMRLMKTSSYYKDLIVSICDYITACARQKKEGYSQPLGWSGPNAGIPFRIIYVPPFGIMINPEWLDNNDGHESEDVKSNCGSLTLKKPITVSRVKSINISFYTLDGAKTYVGGMTKANGGYTFQHEYLHCEGELIQG